MFNFVGELFCVVVGGGGGGGGIMEDKFIPKGALYEKQKI